MWSLWWTNSYCKRASTGATCCHGSGMGCWSRLESISILLLEGGSVDQAPFFLSLFLSIYLVFPCLMLALEMISNVVFHYLFLFCSVVFGFQSLWHPHHFRPWFTSSSCLSPLCPVSLFAPFCLVLLQWFPLVSANYALFLVFAHRWIFLLVLLSSFLPSQHFPYTCSIPVFIGASCDKIWLSQCFSFCIGSTTLWIISCVRPSLLWQI